MAKEVVQTNGDGKEIYEVVQYINRKINVFFLYYIKLLFICYKLQVTTIVLVTLLLFLLAKKFEHPFFLFFLWWFDTFAAVAVVAAAAAAAARCRFFTEKTGY